MPRKNRKLNALLRECERLGLMPEIEAIMEHLKAIDRIVKFAKIKATALTFVRTVEARKLIG